MLTQPKFIAYWQLMRFDKPIGTLLLFFPVSWALLLAYQGHPPILMVIVFTLGVVLTRAAGCIINDLCDRGFDGHVERTKQRPLVTGAVSVTEAYGALLILTVCLLGLLFFLNNPARCLALFAAALTVLYPLTKRFFAYPQLILGITFNMGVLMVFAQAGALSSRAFALYLASVVWTFTYDTVYALADQKDDQRIGLRSSALSLGRYLDIALCVGYAGFFVLLGIAGAHTSTLYAGLIGAILCFVLYPWVLKQWITRSPLAFFKGNAVLGLTISVAMYVLLAARFKLT